MTLELSDLRKLVKPLGYKVKTKALNFGRTVTYVHIETGAELTGNVFTTDTIKRWQALFDVLAKHPANRVEHGGERVIGHLLKM